MAVDLCDLSIKMAVDIYNGWAVARSLAASGLMSSCFHGLHRTFRGNKILRIMGLR